MSWKLVSRWLVAAVSVSAVTVGAWGAVPDEALDALRPDADAKDFAIASAPRVFQFPRDHGKNLLRRRSPAASEGVVCRLCHRR